MKRSLADKKYKWDFSKLYKNEDEWKNDLNKLDEFKTKFEAFKNNLNNKKNFIDYLDLEKEMDILLSKLNQYIHLADIDLTDNKFKTLQTLYENKIQQLNITLSFIDPELKLIGRDLIFKWLKEANYSNYFYRFEIFFKKVSHILDLQDEELLNKLERSRSAVGDLYSTLAYADKQDTKILWNDEEQVLDSSLYKLILEDSDPVKEQNIRELASKLFFKNFTDKKYSFAKVYESIMQKGIENSKIRNFNSVLEMYLFDEQIDSKIYLKLLEVGKKNINLFKEYNLLIKEKYNLKSFNSYDRQLKLASEFNKKFEVEESINIVKQSLKILGEEYCNNLEIAFADNKIDYFEDTNKRDGAYSSGGNGVNPIILMNWDYKLNSVNTLAHEIGHSVHTLFSDKYQQYPLNDYPIILAEVASTLNEHILFDYMFNKVENKEDKIYLLQQRIFDLQSTFFRQIQFADFEYSAHKLFENDEPITCEILSELFKAKENEYGYDIFDNKNRHSNHWPYILHFFESPFYVYKYAIDLVASYKLYEDIQNNNIDTTLQFLKLGGSDQPLVVLKKVGIDFSSDKVYEPLLNALKKYINQLKQLLK